MSDDACPLPSELLARLAFATHARLEEHAASAGLSIQQFRMLGILRDREPTLKELASLTGSDKSSMSGAVARAERRGLVSRIPDDCDGRAVRVRLEPAGRALVDAATADYERDVDRLFAALNRTDRIRWAAVTERLLAAVAGDRGTP